MSQYLDETKKNLTSITIKMMLSGRPEMLEPIFSILCDAAAADALEHASDDGLTPNQCLKRALALVERSKTTIKEKLNV